MKKYTIAEIKDYLDSQDSLGDIHYNLSEENIDKAIATKDKIRSLLPRKKHVRHQ